MHSEASKLHLWHAQMHEGADMGFVRVGLGAVGAFVGGYLEGVSVWGAGLWVF